MKILFSDSSKVSKSPKKSTFFKQLEQVELVPFLRREEFIRNKRKSKSQETQNLLAKVLVHCLLGTPICSDIA